MKLTRAKPILKKVLRKKVKKIIFKTHNLGVALDNLRREDFYPEP